MIPAAVIRIRRSLCKCEGVNHEDPCTGCPQGHFGPYTRRGCDDSNRDIPQPSDLGDKIAAVAQPIARTIDRVFRTNVASCGGCKKMQQNINAGMSIPDAIRERFKKQ